MPSATFLTIDALAGRWNCSRDQISALIGSHQLKPMDISVRRGRRHRPTWRIPLAEVLRFEASRTVDEAPRPQRRRREEAIPRYV